MEFIPSEKKDFYFGKVEEILQEKSLTPKERIPKFRTVMELLFKELTSDENILFTNLHSRQSYYFNKYLNAPSKLYKEVRKFRQFANRVVHEPDFVPTSEEETLILKVLCKTIEYLCRAEVPSSLSEFFPDKELSLRIAEPKQTKLLSVIVHRILKTDQDSPQKRVKLFCESPDSEFITLLIWQNQYHYLTNDLTTIRDFLQPYSNLLVTNVRQDSSSKDYFHTTNKSVIVLESDYLIDVTEIAECFLSSGVYPFIAIIKKFLKSTPSLGLIQGSIVNYIFDEYLTNPNFEFETAFNSAINNNIIKILLLQKDTENGKQDSSSISELGRSTHRPSEKNQSQANSSLIVSTEEKHIDLFIANIKKTVSEHLQRLTALKKVAGKKFIEPSFISKNYGIQGRLDLLVQSFDNRNHINIFELKSGSAPSTGMWQNHLIQTVLYDLLITSVFPERSGISYIIYSADNKSPLRAYPGAEWTNQQQSAIMVRNKIVSYLMRIASGELYNLLDENKDIKEQNLPLYLKNEVDIFYNTINQLDIIEKTYFQGFTRFLAKELIQLKIGSNNPNNPSDGYASLWRNTLSSKRDTFSVLDNLQITSFETPSSIELQSQGEVLPVSDFRKGDLAILYPMIDDSTDPSRFLIVKCVITDIGNKHVKIDLLNKEIPSDYFNSYELWVLEHDFRESNYTALFQSLYTFISADKQKRDLILGLTKPEFSDSKFQLPSSLLSGQKKVISSALSAKDYFLIQGPPGTGKTSIILKELVRQLVAAKENILLIAYTNRAVDEICERISEISNLEFIRIGKSENKSTLLSELLKKSQLKELAQKLKSIPVFVSTQASLLTHAEILELKTFDTLIVDESSQLLEPHLCGILTKVKRFILIGDEKQLPPVVIQSKEEISCKDKILNDIGLYDYGESIFTRLLKNAKSKGWNDCYASLVEHFRMHKNIASFINMHYYDSILTEVLADQILPPKQFSEVPEFDKILTSNRLIFISVPAESFRNKVNEQEARLVSFIAKRFNSLYKKLDNNNFNPQIDIGIITPFRAQISAIKEFLSEEFSNITVDTVERFQGSERRIVIISFAFKNLIQAKMIQSIYSSDAIEVERKLNVAVSRAKEYLVAVGDIKILEQDNHYKKLLDYISLNGKVFDYKEIRPYLPALY